MGRRIVAILCVVLGALAPVGEAHAHAALVESTPGDGATLAQPPDAIVLRFNEPVMPVAVRLIDGAGRTVASTAASERASDTVRLYPTGAFSDGSYVVSWRVVSVDSHPIGGSFVFAVGRAAAAPADAASDEAVREAGWQLAAIADRLLQYAALLAAGTTLFMLVVLRARPRELRVFVGVAASATLFATVLAIGIRGGWIAAAPANAIFGVEIWDIGRGASGATAIAIAAGLMLMLFGSFTRNDAIGIPAAFAGAILAPAGFALTGHAVTAEPRWLAQGALALHTAAAAFWIGAFWPLLRIVRADPSQEAAKHLRRFSDVAIAVVSVLLLAGIVSAAMHIDGPNGFIDTVYGRALFFKLAFVAMLLMLAAINRRRLTPAVASGEAWAVRALARNIRVEIGFATIVLLLTAVLAHTPPGEVAARHEHTHTSAPRKVMVAIPGESGRTLYMTISPAAAGPNMILLQLRDQHERPLAALEVTAAFTLKEAQVEPFVRMAVEADAGTYRLDRIVVPIAGRWHVRAEALISDFEKAVFEADLTIR